MSGRSGVYVPVEPSLVDGGGGWEECWDTIDSKPDPDKDPKLPIGMNLGTTGE